MDMIYLDNAATSVVSKKVLARVNEVLEQNVFNPSSSYALLEREIIERSRLSVAKALKVQKECIYFTSGATESNNLALFCGFKNKKGELVCSKGEHDSVFNTATAISNDGKRVVFANLMRDGRVDEQDLLSKINQDTALVSVIHAGNETGAQNDIASICAKVKRINKNTLFHSDGVQGFLKGAFDLGEVDLYSVSAHKVGGIKGAGALYIRKGLKLRPLIYGGGQEGGLRGGTQNLAAIAAFGEAVESAPRLTPDMAYSLKQAFISTVATENIVNLSNENCNSFIIALSLIGKRAEVVQNILSAQKIYVGIGSACSSSKRDNRVLSAMGLDKATIEGAIRVSFGAQNTLEEVVFAAKKIKEIALG